MVGGCYYPYNFYNTDDSSLHCCERHELTNDKKIVKYDVVDIIMAWEVDENNPLPPMVYEHL